MSTTKTVAAPDQAIDLDSLRASLELKRREMLELYEHDVRVGKESTDDNSDDFADRANNAFNRELMFSLSDSDRQMLIRIEDAFERLEKGTYGMCDSCEKPIGPARLEALPWARFCIRCQELEERGLLDF